MKNSDYLYSEGGMLVLRVENMWKWFGSVKCFTASWTGFVSYAMNDSQVLVEFWAGAVPLHQSITDAAPSAAKPAKRVWIISSETPLQQGFLTVWCEAKTQSIIPI